MKNRMISSHIVVNYFLKVLDGQKTWRMHTVNISRSESIAGWLF